MPALYQHLKRMQACSSVSLLTTSFNHGTKMFAQRHSQVTQDRDSCFFLVAYKLIYVFATC
jgi:hypothetical protein